MSMDKPYLTVKDVAPKLGVTEAYVRDLLNRAKFDNTIKLKGKRIGKEWRIDPKSVNDFLGINRDEENYKKDLYIKELEGRVKLLESKVNSFKSLAATLHEVIKV